MKFRLLCFCVCVLCVAFAAEVTLVKNGNAEAVIVLKSGSTKSAQLGAFELQHHVKLITGVELPIAEAPAAGKLNIRIGGGNEPLKGETNIIKFSQDGILLTGCDHKDYGTVDYSNADTFPSSCFYPNGTLNAVYDFLENYCGVRFYWMDETGTTYKARKTLTVPVRDRTFSPPLDAFREVHVDDWTLTPESLRISGRDYALWRLRWRMNTYYGQTNHNQYSIYFAHWGKAKSEHLAPAFVGKREELFAKGFKGRKYPVDRILRSNYPDDADIPPQLCYSNHDTVKYYANEVLTYFNGGNVPGGWLNFSGRRGTNLPLLPRFEGKPFFYPIQGGDTGGHCLCVECKKRFPEDDKNDVSNNKFQFIADVAREAAKVDKRAGVASLAYIQTLKYPDKVELPDNVSVQLCLTIYSWWHPVSYQKQYDAYREWMSKEAKRRPITLWTYIFSTYWDSRFHFGNYKPFPGLYPHKTGELFKMFTGDGIRGWFTEVEMRYNHLEAYIAAKVCYDPSVDPEKIIDEYFNDYYGAAGPAMREVYEEIEGAYWNSANCPEEWLKDKDVMVGPKGVKHPYWGTGLHSPELNWSLGTPERMAKLGALIEEARKKVSTPNEKKRLARFVEVIWENTLAGLREHELVKIRKETPPRHLGLKPVPDANGDFSRIDWSKAAKTEKWQTLDGLESPNRISMGVAIDSTHLYIDFLDPDGKDSKAESIWRDNLELFFTSARKFPVAHVAVATDGTVNMFRHKSQTEHESADFGVKVGSRLADGKWSVKIAIPLTELPYKDNSLFANFFRMKTTGATSWTPIFSNAFIQGTDVAGTITVYPKIVGCDSFSYSGKGTASGVSADGKTAWMNGNRGWSVAYRPMQDFPPGRYSIAVNFRTDAPAEPDNYNNIGVYSYDTKKHVLVKPVQTAFSSGKEFKRIELGECELKGNVVIFIGGFVKKLDNNMMHIQSMELVKLDD